RPTPPLPRPTGAAHGPRRMARAVPRHVAREPRQARAPPLRPARSTDVSPKEGTTMMNEATLLRAGDRPVLRFERHLSRTIDDVWRACTTPEGLHTWFPTRIEIDEWKVGAHLTHHFEGHAMDPLSGEVLECDPPRRLSFTWGTDT